MTTTDLHWEPTEAYFLDKNGGGCLFVRQLDDGRWIGVRPFLYTFGLLVNLDQWGFSERYCYPDLLDALRGFATWEGVGDPSPGWVKEAKSGRRRDLITGREWVEH